MQPELPDDVKQLWQNQPMEDDVFVTDIRNRVQQYERKIRGRALWGYLACAFVAASHLYYVWLFQTPLAKIGAGIIVAGACALALNLHRLASMRFPAADSSASSLVDFYRDVLSKRRKRFGQILIPVSPLLLGMAVMLAGLALAYKGDNWLRHFGPFCGLLVLWFCVLWFRHRREMAALQREIETMDRLVTVLPEQP
jgi:hypothetical protein